MDGYLRQSTASQVRTIGPFVDDTDFKTLENALTIANTDILLKKNGAASGAKNSGGATADTAGGLYHLTFDATDTSTVGELAYSVKVAGALAVFGKFTVLEEAVFDALFAASAAGYSTFAGGAVASVTGNVGGNVAGSVASVTAGVTLADSAITTAKIQDGAFTAAKFASGAFDAVWSVAARSLTTFGTLAADVWAVATRTLSAGTNIVLAKGTGVTGFNDLSAAQVNAEVDTALTDYDGPTYAELTAALATADDATLAAIAALNNLSSTEVGDAVDAKLDAILPDSVPADGTRPSVKQALYVITQFLTERSVSGTTLTVRKPDGSTALMTFTLSDATHPTSITRAT
jgi:hypothetical protein